MTDGSKIVLGAVAALISSMIGFLVRDSLDAPRPTIQAAKYRVTRLQCKIEPKILFPLRASQGLRDAIEEVVPWSFARDLEDWELEYDHVEDLLRQLPVRAERLNRELPFISEADGLVAAFQQNDSPETRSGVRKAIILGLAPSKPREDAGPDGATSMVDQLYDAFEQNPIVGAQRIRARLSAKIDLIRSEINAVEQTLPSLRACYQAGRPAIQKMVGQDLSGIPNTEFLMSVSNQGKTAARVSFVVIFSSKGGRDYEIRLVGQSPIMRVPLPPDRFATVEGYGTDELVYAIDPVRNRFEDVALFYNDLTSEQGLSGTFTMSDIRGKKFNIQVKDLQPIN